MYFYYVLRGKIFGIRKLLFNEIVDISYGVEMWDNVPLFLVNIVENEFVKFDKSYELDFIQLYILLLNFLNINGVTPVLVDTQSQKMNIYEIVIEFPDTEEENTVRFTYSNLISNDEMLRIFASTIQGTPENNVFLMNTVVDEKYNVYYRGKNIKYVLPSLIREGMKTFKNSVVGKIRPDVYKNFFKFFFAYTQKAHSFPLFKNIYPEDIQYMSSVLSEFVEKEKKEYEKLERERKRIEQGGRQ